MKFSVIIPCFNASATIAETLQSCLDQGPVVEQIITVDDHSTDNTKSILSKWAQSHPQIQVLANEKKGGCSARNLGMKYAQSELIQWLDADDTLGLGKLDFAKKFHQEWPNQILACPWQPMTGHLQNQYLPISNDRWRNIPIHSTPADWIAEDRHMVPHCYTAHRSVFERVAPWDESLLINQDGEYMSRVIAASGGVTFTRDVAVGYRQSSSNSVSRFSPEKADSLFRSIESMAQTALHLEDSDRMRQMISNRWQDFIYTVYPHATELRRKAQCNLKRLPRPNLTNPQTVSKTSQLFSQVFGWKALVHIRRIRSHI